MKTFNFCPDSLVPEMMPREQGTVVTMNSWTFTSKPTTPFVKTWRLTLHGLHWILDDDDFYDEDETPQINARALELFYQEHELWSPFLWVHPHTGKLAAYRFKNVVVIPKALPNSNGLIDPVEIQLIEHNPGYAP